MDLSRQSQGLRDRIADKLKNLVAVPLERGRHHAVTLAVASSKGGVGKTTTCVNLAVALAQRGLHTLLVDLDPQAHVAASLQPRSQGAPLSEVLLGRLRDVCEVARPSQIPGLDLAGSDKQLAETETILAAKIGKELLLDRALATTRTRYQVILVDCPPNLGTLTLNALSAADYLLIPSDMSVLAVEGVSDILGAVDTLKERLGRRLDVLGILATRVDRRATRVNDTIAQSVSDLFGGLLLPVRIPQASALNKAHLAQKPVFDLDRHSPGALAYQELADLVVERLQLTTPARAQASVTRRAAVGRR